jgi:hypothetical protein
VAVSVAAAGAWDSIASVKLGWSNLTPFGSSPKSVIEDKRFRIKEL